MTSFIGIRNSDKTVTFIASTENTGARVIHRLLKKEFSNETKLRELLALGDIVALGAEVAPKKGIRHDFLSRQPGVTVALFRDCQNVFMPAETIPGGMKSLINAAVENNVEHVHLFNPHTSRWIRKAV